MRLPPDLTGVRLLVGQMRAWKWIVGAIAMTAIILALVWTGSRPAVNQTNEDASLQYFH
jgi:hypothetical protein